MSTYTKFTNTYPCDQIFLKIYSFTYLQFCFRCVAGSNDKASTEPLNKELNDSVDSLEEKNPDIIPQNNGDDEYQDEERAFDRLNNATLRVYSRMQSPTNQNKNGSYDGYGKTVSKIILPSAWSTFSRKHS